MAEDTPQVRILRQALEAVGSEKHLATALGASPSQIGSWLSGEREVPAKPFFAALDIVAGRSPAVAEPPVDERH